jgi:hypothetical protein
MRLNDRIGWRERERDGWREREERESTLIVFHILIISIVSLRDRERGLNIRIEFRLKSQREIGKVMERKEKARDRKGS